MTLAELINEVYIITNRPDRVNETASAVRSATLKAHQVDYFYKDIFETGVAFDAAAYVQQLDYRTILPQWRALKYLRKFDPTTNTPGMLIKPVEPLNIFDDYSLQKQDVCYIAGSNLNINSSTQQQYYLLGAYMNPNVTTAGFNSWAAIDHPWAIIYEAAALVFQAIGKDEEFTKYRQVILPEQIGILKESNITSIGY